MFSNWDLSMLKEVPGNCCTIATKLTQSDFEKQHSKFDKKHPLPAQRVRSEPKKASTASNVYQETWSKPS